MRSMLAAHRIQLTQLMLPNLRARDLLQRLSIFMARAKQNLRVCYA